jgi:two-component system LytT family response regulator
MIRAVIIDDEALARETISEMLSVYCDDIQVVGQAEGVKEGVDVINNTDPDLLLLDIQLTDGTGFDLLKSIHDPSFRVIFITAYEDYALRAFKFSALDYLLKPIDPNELIESVDRMRSSMKDADMNLKLKALFSNIDTFSREDKKIVLKTANNVHIVNLTDIIRCQSDKNYTHFYIANHESVVVSRTLKDYESILSGYKFFRAHQSHLINLSHIKRYEKSDGGYLVMSDDSVVPVSFRKKEELMRLFNSF